MEDGASLATLPAGPGPLALFALEEQEADDATAALVGSQWTFCVKGAAGHARPTHRLRLRSNSVLQVWDLETAACHGGGGGAGGDAATATEGESAEGEWTVDDAGAVGLTLPGAGGTHALRMEPGGLAMTAAEESSTSTSTSTSTTASAWLEVEGVNAPRHGPQSFITLAGANFSTLASGGTVHGDTVRSDFQVQCVVQGRPRRCAAG